MILLKILFFFCEVANMVFTLENFINDCGFSGIRLLTCKDKLDSPVVGVNVIDNPDVTQWVKPGEMVLTTGYFFANDLNLQTNVIMNLKAAGCSALCIKLKRFFPDDPEILIQTAEKAGLPVVSIPVEYTFSEITKKIHEQLDNSQVRKIQQEQILFDSLLNAFQSDNPLETSLKLLSNFLSLSLFIVDSQLQCLSFFLRPEDRELLSATDTLLLKAPDLKKNPIPIDAVSQRTVTILSREQHVTLIPFPNQVHFLCILKEAKELPMPLVQRAMKFFLFPKERLQKTPINLSEYYRDFFRILLSGDKKKKTAVNQICEYYGYPHCKAQLCILFSLRPKEDSCQLQAPIVFLKEILHNRSVKPSSYFLAPYQRQICLFLLSDGEDCYQTAFQCVDDFQKKYYSSFVAGISQVIQGDREIIKTYEQAAFLLTLADIFPSRSSFFFKDYVLFWHVKELSAENKYKIYQDTVKPLVDYDAENNSCLVDTLVQYFDARFNASLAAKQLYVHRNTFLKRMQKIGELVSFDQDNINSLLSLYYGICIYLTERY